MDDTENQVDRSVNQTQYYVRKMSAEEKLEDEKFREKIAAMYYGRDGYVWTEQIKRKGYVQHGTTPDGLDTVMLKARATLNVNIHHVRQVCCNVKLRAEWETILYDLQGMDITEDMNSMKVYYVFKSPRVGFIGIVDRDFLMQQDVIWDFPEKGMMTAICRSIEDDRMPNFKNKVRATAHVIAMVLKPDTDAKGNDLTHCMLLTNVDINGLVPKWIVNIGARSAPSQWFTDCQKACDDFVNGKFKVKPSDITDWRYGPMPQ